MNSCKLYLIPFLVVVLATNFSCKKSANNSLSNTRIAALDITHNGGVRHYHIVYDRFNNVDSFVVVGGGYDTGYNGYTFFNYIGSSYNITDGTGSFLSIYAYSNGLILKVLQKDTLNMLYNSSNQLAEINVVSPITRYPYDSVTFIYYNWNNGDMTDYNSNGVNWKYDYDNSHTGQIGDAIRINEFLTYGRSFIKSNHIPKDFYTGNIMTEQYLYTYDGSGRISVFTKILVDHTGRPNDTTTYSYFY